MGWRGTRLRTPDNEQRSDSFDTLRWASEIEDLVTEMTHLDPRGGCWEWVQANLGDTWASLMAGMKRIDVAFERQAAGDIQEAIVNTRQLYHESITAWDKRGHRKSG